MKLALREALPIAVPLCGLLVIFNMTNGVLGAILGPLAGWRAAYDLTWATDSVGLWVLGIGYFGHFMGNSPLASFLSNMYRDLLSLALLTTMFYALKKQHSLVRAIQTTSLVLMILPVEIYLGDYSEFNLHVTQFQSYLNVIPWFTNADLLYCTVAVVALTVVIDAWRRLSTSRTKRIGQAFISAFKRRVMRA